MLLFSCMQVACGGCHTMVMANKMQADEDELDLPNESLDNENQVCILWNLCVFTI
jgi:ferredoxin